MEKLWQTAVLVAIGALALGGGVYLAQTTGAPTPTPRPHTTQCICYCGDDRVSILGHMPGSGTCKSKNGESCLTGDGKSAVYTKCEEMGAPSATDKPGFMTPGGSG